MDYMEFSIALPPLVELTNAGVEWNTMKQRLYTHLHPNQGPDAHHSHTSWRPFLVSMAAEQVQGIFDEFDVSYEETAKFCKILQSIEDICLPRFLIIYNRFRFFTCKQNGPEFNGFLQQLLAWSDLCEFGDLKDILLKDCIISGISEDSVRQRLLETEQLDFDKTVDICRAVLAKEDSSDDFPLSNKECVNASTSTHSKEEDYLVSWNQCVEKFCMATNTCLEVTDKATQTMAVNSPVENNLTVNKTYSIKPFGVDDNNDQEFSDVYAHQEPFMSYHQDSFPQNENFLNYNQPGAALKPDLALPEDTGLVGSCEKTMTTLQPRGSFTDQKPPQVIQQDAGNERVREDEGSYKSSPHKGSNGLDMPDHDHAAKDSSSSNPHIPVSNPAVARLKCRSCKAVFKDLRSLHKHRKTHEEEKRYNCDICPAKFFNSSHLKVHRRLHTGERPFVCDICGDSYIEASKLKAHKRKHTGERPYKCTVCQMTFTWSAAFKRHKRTHTGEKPYTCEYCGGMYSDFTALQRHTRTHTKDKPYKCEECSYSFGDPAAFRAHRRIHTGERPYRCKYCDSSFTRAHHVKQHMKIHLGEKPFKCNPCGAVFLEASKLKSHMRRHTGERPYVCKVCGASFAWTAAFTRHLRTHTFEKPYPCKVCGSCFADHSTLIRHFRTHTGERPFHCNLCGFRFADSSSLTRHQKIHTGEKAFVCEICGSSFVVKSYLKRHMKIHTGEKPYACDKCDSKFSESSKLKRHQKIHERASLKEVRQHSMISTESPPAPNPIPAPIAAAAAAPPPPPQPPPFPPPPLVYPALNLRHDMPHFQDDEFLSQLSKSCSFDHMGKPDHHFVDPMQGHDSEVGGALGLAFPQPHDECLDLATSVSASLVMTPGMESLANILSFDS